MQLPFPFQGFWIATHKKLLAYIKHPLWKKENALALPARDPLLEWGYPEKSNGKSPLASVNRTKAMLWRHPYNWLLFSLKLPACWASSFTSAHCAESIVAKHKSKFGACCAGALLWADVPPGFTTTNVVPYDPRRQELVPVARVIHMRNGYSTLDLPYSKIPEKSLFKPPFGFVVKSTDEGPVKSVSKTA